MSSLASYLIAAICVANTSSCSSNILVTFYWKAKYYYLFRSFIVFFIKLTSSFTFFFLSSFLPVNYSSISNSSAISLFRELSLLFWFEAEVFNVFFTDVDRTGFYFFIYYFFGSYFLGDDTLGCYFFAFTPELFYAEFPAELLLGGALFGGIIG